MCNTYYIWAIIFEVKHSWSIRSRSRLVGSEELILFSASRPGCSWARYHKLLSRPEGHCRHCGPLAFYELYEDVNDLPIHYTWVICTWFAFAEAEMRTLEILISDVAPATTDCWPLFPIVYSNVTSMKWVGVLHRPLSLWGKFHTEIIRLYRFSRLVYRVSPSVKNFL